MNTLLPVSKVNHTKTRAHDSGVYVVSQVARSWNTLYPDLVLMQHKLKELGLVSINGEIVYQEGEDGDV